MPNALIWRINFKNRSAIFVGLAQARTYALHVGQGPVVESCYVPTTLSRGRQCRTSVSLTRRDGRHETMGLWLADASTGYPTLAAGTQTEHVRPN